MSALAFVAVAVTCLVGCLGRSQILDLPGCKQLEAVLVNRLSIIARHGHGAVAFLDSPVPLENARSVEI